MLDNRLETLSLVYLLTWYANKLLHPSICLSVYLSVRLYIRCFRLSRASHSNVKYYTDASCTVSLWQPPLIYHNVRDLYFPFHPKSQKLIPSLYFYNVQSPPPSSLILTTFVYPTMCPYIYIYIYIYIYVCVCVCVEKITPTPFLVVTPPFHFVHISCAPFHSSLAGGKTETVLKQRRLSKTVIETFQANGRTSLPADLVATPILKFLMIRAPRVMEGLLSSTALDEKEENSLTDWRWREQLSVTSGSDDNCPKRRWWRSWQQNGDNKIGSRRVY